MVPYCAKIRSAEEASAVEGKLTTLASAAAHAKADGDSKRVLGSFVVAYRLGPTFLSPVQEYTREIGDIGSGTGRALLGSLQKSGIYGVIVAVRLRKSAGCSASSKEDDSSESASMGSGMDRVRLMCDAVHNLLKVSFARLCH